MRTTNKQTSPLGQVAEAEETVELVIFAESPAGCYVDGAALQVHSSLMGVTPAYQVRVGMAGVCKTVGPMRLARSWTRMPCPE